MGRWGRFGERPGIRRATASVSECLGRGGSKGSVKLEMVEPVYELSPMNIESFSCFLESCLNLSFYFIKIYIYIYLLIYFWLCRVFVATANTLVSGCSVLTSHCGGVSCCGARVPGLMGISRCGA